MASFFVARLLGKGFAIASIARKLVVNYLMNL